MRSSPPSATCLLGMSCPHTMSPICTTSISSGETRHGEVLGIPWGWLRLPMLNVAPGVDIDVKRVDALDERVSIAMVGKYTGLTDSYLSVIKALTHASIDADRRLDILWIEAGDLEDASRKATTLQERLNRIHR